MRELRSAKPFRGDYYIVTHDVASRLQVFRKAALKVPSQNDPIFRDFHRGLHARTQSALGNVSVHTVHITTVARGMWKAIQGAIIGNPVIVTTCPEVAQPLKGDRHILHVNRLFNKSGKMMGYGPRPGCPSLREQLDLLAKKANGRPAVLMEEGAFTGGSIRFLLNEIEMRGIKVPTTIIGFCSSATRDRIGKNYNGRLIVINEIGELVDWITDHDLVPFTPGCGRVLGKQTAIGFEPVRAPEGFTFAYPYVLPFGRAEEWATLPAEGALEISKFCLEAGADFYRRILKQDGAKVTIGDLMRASPTVSMPITVGESAQIPSFEAKAADFLEHMRFKLD
jgi:hypothetical protein